MSSNHFFHLFLIFIVVSCTQQNRYDEVFRLKNEIVDEAFESIDSALVRIDSAENAGLLTSAAANATRALVCFNTNWTLLASFYAELAMSDPELSLDSSDYSIPRWVMADIACENGDYGKSIALSDELLDYVGDANSALGRSLRSMALSQKAECESGLKHDEQAKAFYMASIDNMMAGSSTPGSFGEVEPLLYTALTLADEYYQDGDIADAISLLPVIDTAMARLSRCSDAGSYVYNMRRNNYLIFQAMLFAADGQLDRADALYCEHCAADGLTDIDIVMQGRYLAQVGRYDEAIRRFRVADSIRQESGEPLSSGYINERLMCEYKVLKQAGRTADALALGDRIRTLTDSVVLIERRSDVEQTFEIRRQHEEIMQKRMSLVMHRIILVAAVVIILLIAYLLHRTYRYNKELLAKNVRLLAEIERREADERRTIMQLESQPEETLTNEQQIFLRLCTLMENPDLFTDPDLDRRRLAKLLGTNEHYVSDAISYCADGKTVTEFLNSYRMRHAAHLLATTDDAIALIAEISGFSRSSFYRLFNEAYSMSPSDYRRVARSK